MAAARRPSSSGDLGPASWTGRPSPISSAAVTSSSTGSEIRREMSSTAPKTATTR